MSTADVPETEVLALLRAGHTNAEINRRTGAGRARVGRIRRAHRIPNVPQSVYCGRKDHPQGRRMRLLLSEGYTNAEIARRTGADVTTVRRYRRLGGFGPATIRPRTDRQRHPRHDDIAARLATATDKDIAAELGVDKSCVAKVRRELGVLFVPTRGRPVAERWAEMLLIIRGGHLVWNGPRSRPGPGGSPVLKVRGRNVSPGRLGFEWATGRAPVGSVLPECGQPGCLAPDHLDDAAGRTEVRVKVRYLLGKPKARETCVRGHDQAVYGRYEPNGNAHCAACRRDNMRVHRAA
ncbi:hypothetical protein [Kitasatospora aureofaciens]|uniref:hypothetical protein n=1 Tax=Kitasatospora aureofaciens TaxID=1894 RepID=UPI00340061F6